MFIRFWGEALFQYTSIALIRSFCYYNNNYKLWTNKPHYLKAVENNQKQADFSIWKKALVEYLIFMTFSLRVGPRPPYLATRTFRLSGLKNRVWGNHNCFKVKRKTLEGREPKRGTSDFVNTLSGSLAVLWTMNVLVKLQAAQLIELNWVNPSHQLTKIKINHSSE